MLNGWLYFDHKVLDSRVGEYQRVSVRELLDSNHDLMPKISTNIKDI